VFLPDPDGEVLTGRVGDRVRDPESNGRPPAEDSPTLKSLRVYKVFFLEEV